MKQFIRRHITGRPLWVNVLWALGLLLLLLLIFVFSLNGITRHGLARNVPSVTGKTLAEAEQLLKAGGFDYVIQDSVFYDSLPPSAVLKQIPEADAVVKVNRTVYLIVNRVIAPDVDMPNLVGFSLRNAEMMLQNIGLHMGDTTMRAGIAAGSILEQQVNGAPIAPGTKIKVGSRVDFVVSGGAGAEANAVPNLVGMTFSEAKASIEAGGYMLGGVAANGVTDSASAYVIWQNPPVTDSKGRPLAIHAGQMIDLRLDVNPPPPPVDTTQPASLPPQ